SLTPLVTVRVQDIVKYVNQQLVPTTYTPAGIEACDNSGIASGGTTATIYILVLDNETNGSANSANYPIAVDMLGPAPPANVATAIGDTALIVNWTASTDPDTQGYTVYVDPPPNGVQPQVTGPDGGAT